MSTALAPQSDMLILFCFVCGKVKGAEQKELFRPWLLLSLFAGFGFRQEVLHDPDFVHCRSLSGSEGNPSPARVNV